MKRIALPILGFLVAPPAGALMWIIWEGGFGEILSGITAWAIMVSLLIGIVPGVPTYIFLRARNAVNLISLTIGGSVISMLPWVLLSYPGNTTKSIVGKTTIIENGSYTLEGIIYQMKFIGKFGALGAASGVIFWFIVKSLVTSQSSRPAAPSAD